jgi:hypothetical protein
MAHFSVPRNLPHAAIIAGRLERRLLGLHLEENPEAHEIWQHVDQLQEVLGKYAEAGDPPPDEAKASAEAAAEIGRKIVDELERLEAREDRLGQTIRNLFECLGLGEEGAEISLRAGEDPNSIMRPR